MSTLTQVQVTSEEAGPLLATFGFTDLLLCTLCLDSSIREYIVVSVDGTGMASLIDKAEKFILPAKAKDADFFERFSSTIDTLKGI